MHMLQSGMLQSREEVAHIVPEIFLNIQLKEVARGGSSWFDL